MSTVWADLVGAEVKYYQAKYRTRVIEAGQGEPLILIHGRGGHAETWSKTLMGLAQHYRVLAIDLLYHGFSQGTEQDGKIMDRYMDQIIDLMDQIGADKIYLEGESLGGWTTMLFAYHHPERLNKIILDTTVGVAFKDEAMTRAQGSTSGSGFPFLNDPSTENIRAFMERLVLHPEKITDELVEIRQKIYSRPESQVGLRYVFSQPIPPESPYTLTEEQLTQIKVPCLVLWSDHNNTGGEDMGQRIHSLIKGSEYYCIKDAGHWPEWEQPEEHNDAVLKFLLAPVRA